MARTHKTRLDGTPLIKPKSNGEKDKQFDKLNKLDEDKEEPLALIPQVKVESLEREEAEEFEGDDVDWQLNGDKEGKGLSEKDDEVKEDNRQCESVKGTDDKAPLQFINPPKRKARLRVNGKVKCYFCNKLFTLSSNCCRHEYEKHSELKTGKKQPEEEDDEDDPEENEGPILTDFQIGRFSCRVCGKGCRSRYGLQRHERPFRETIGNGKRFRCEFCKRKFISRQCFKWHKWSQQGVSSSAVATELKKFSCEFCDKTLLSKRNLRNHENSHDKLKTMEKGSGRRRPPVIRARRSTARKLEWVDGKVKCGQCDKLVASAKNLSQHEKTMHPKTPGQFICDLCETTWDSSSYLLSHRRRTHGVRPDGSPCISKICKKPRRRRERYEKREGYGQLLPDGKTVVGRQYEAVDGKLKCRFCDRLFESPSGVCKHEQEKHPKVPATFICTHCGMAFNSLEYLRVHSERKHWLKLDGTQFIPPWVPTRKYKWKKSEN